MKYFLIIGNGRTGSTWLETSFDQLADVSARREIKWRLPYQTDHPMHRYIGSGTRSIKDALPRPENGQEPVEVIGSKLIFDPYGYLSSAVFDHLDRIIDDDVRLIHLRRPYVEIFRSWKLRGVAHAVNEAALAGGRIDPVLVESISRLDPESGEMKRILLTVGGVPMTAAAETEASPEPILYPLEDAVDDLLVYFHNDIFAYSRILSYRACMALEYDDIQQTFSALARFVGSAAGEGEIDAVLHSPATARLQQLEASLIEPAGVLERFSDCLAHAFQAVMREPRAGIRPWIVDEEGGTAAVNIANFGSLLKEYGISWDIKRRRKISSLVTRRRKCRVCWPLRKPVYR